ncbi:glycosyltransferase family 4 protein [Rhizobium sp. CFBP 8762]|uniref:glycosyltransferase family 4 protein n=1 Tax=Rhizobium sp. CFBP 8762 TaxID=2775279 RepID=UPI001782712E|nr:glycosyltransferase family 4 protein [Rhizobium sp. CFBP 8762]MBD8552993.1 glycosyltransferase family 4 protein [Rhizobium sp. CFBP 8762]
MPNGRPLRILHCFRSPIGGIFRHVRELTIAHAAAGHEVGIICDSTTGGPHEDALFDALKPFLSLGLQRLPIRRSIGLSDMRLLVSAYQDIKALKPDVLHGHGAKGGLIARLIGAALRYQQQPVARIYSPHGGSLHFDARTLTGKMFFSVERLMERATDALIFVCEFERQTYRAKVGEPHIASAVVYNGLPESDFAPVTANTDAADFLFIGMLRDLKGPDIFLRAFAQTERNAGRPLSAVIVGDGPNASAYRQYILKHGFSKRIEMRPTMNARDAFALARCVVVPSRAESLPYIVLEALAADKPVLASRVGGIPEILGQESPALARPNDPLHLADLMTSFLHDAAALNAAMPDDRTLRHSFSASQMSARICDIYRTSLP